MTERVAVIDQGSTATKGAVYEGNGALRITTAEPTRTQVDGSRVEHNPAAIADSVRRVLSRLLDQGGIAAIGLTCQRSTCLVWERHSGRPVTTARSWQDTSCAARAAAMRAHEPEVILRTGLRLSPHYAALKLARLLREIPSGFEKAAAGELVAGTLDAFLTRQLTGRESTEAGHAGRTLLYNLERGAWDPELCRIFEIPPECLPVVEPSASIRGEVRGVPLAALCGDQQAALLGHGGWAQGVVAAHFGTGAFVLGSVGDTPVRHRGLLSAAVATTTSSRRFQLEGSVNSAGSAVDRMCRLLGITIDEVPDQPIPIDTVPWVVPAFSGLAAPWWAPEAGALVDRLRLDTTAQDILMGTLLGIAMRVVDNLEALTNAGVAVRTLRVSGKLTRFEGLAQLLADAGQTPVAVSAEEETGLAGTARLARAGLTGDEGRLADPPATRATYEPAWSSDRALAARSRWRSLVRSAIDAARA